MGSINKNIDHRAKLTTLSRDPDVLDRIFGPDDSSNILAPLRRSRGLVFPYRPNVVFGGSANYGDYSFPHTNYSYGYWQNSTPSIIQLETVFTAQTQVEAQYMIAAIHFLRFASKGYFGLNSGGTQPGTPPPVLSFSYAGAFMFDNLPTVITNYMSNFERDLDWVPVELNEDITRQSGLESGPGVGEGAGESPISHRVEKTGITYVPTKQFITIELRYQPNPRQLRQQFDLDAFKRGDLITAKRSGRGGKGGFI